MSKPTPYEREAILDVLQSRTQKTIPDMLDKNFVRQSEFITDPHRLKALFCTRRSAKSYTGGLHLVKTALENPAVNCLYLGLTRISAKGIIWKDILKSIDRKHNLNMKFNGSELTATTENGSMIYVTGVDADADSMQKLLGKKYKLVIIDEAASYKIDLKELIYGILKPSTIDQGGTICLMGTSGNITKGLFFDITNAKEPGWKLYQWSAHDNPYVAKQWQEELDDIRTNRPLFMETPLFKQWYLNQWVIDDDKLVYRFKYNRNEYSNLETRKDWQYVLGVDLGYEDASAFVVAAFHQHDPTLFIVETYKQSEMDITEVANKIKELERKYSIYKIVVDGANKQAVAEMQKRHGIALTAADKTGKADFIQIMNAEFIQAKIKLSPHCKDLIDEYLGLIWNERSLRKEEHPNCDNHLCDAALYAWRFCYQFLSAPAEQPIDLRSRQAWVDHTSKLMEQALEKQIEKQQNDINNEDLWNISNMDPDANPLQYYLNKKKAG